MQVEHHLVDKVADVGAVRAAHKQLPVVGVALGGGPRLERGHVPDLEAHLDRHGRRFRGVGPIGRLAKRIIYVMDLFRLERSRNDILILVGKQYSFSTRGNSRLFGSLSTRF